MTSAGPHAWRNRASGVGAVLAAAAPLLAGCAGGPLRPEGKVMLAWDPPPTEETAGGHALKGYRIFFWSAGDNRVSEIDVPNPKARKHRIGGLPRGEYYFSMVAYDERGVQSELSNVRRKNVR